MLPFSKLKAEVRREWRRRYREEMERTGQPLPADFKEEEPGDGDLFPPDAQRVARRACCLAAVAQRGLASTWSHEDQREILPTVTRWFAGAGLDDEIEPAELEILRAPASELDSQGAIDACWRWEGAAVLAAALGRLTLPPYDQVVNTEICGEACGLYFSRARLGALISSASFDRRFDRFAYANRVLSLHWRLRQYLHRGVKQMDFVSHAALVQWAEFDLQDLRMIDRDLIIGNEPIGNVSPDDFGTTMSIANQRHIAANWLIGWDEVFSETEAPT